MSKRRTMLVDALAICALVASAVTLAASDTPRAVAEENVSSEIEPAPVESPRAEGLTPRNPFEPYAAGPGAIPYENLATREQQAVMRTAEWADTTHGYGVHQAWRGASEYGRAHASKKGAEREAGLVGVSDGILGVE